MAHSYRDLHVWQKSMDLVESIYRVTQNFPKEETYGLVSQMRRAAVSVPSNIAEGQGKMSHGEFRQAIGHARGSLLELETQVLISQRLGYLGQLEVVDLLEKATEIRRMLHGLAESLLETPPARN
jgi:four helix bundle protein